MKNFYLCLIYISALFLELQAQNVWLQKNDFPGTERTYSIAFSYDSDGDGTNDKAIAGLGENALKDYWRYDPATDYWDSVGVSPMTASQNMMMTEVDNKFYFCGGEPLSDELWEYDPVIDSWTLKSSFPIGDVTEGVAFTIDSVAYFGSGVVINLGFSNTFFAYYPQSNTWDTISDFSAEQAVSVDLEEDGKFDKAYLLRNNAIYEYLVLQDTFVQTTIFPGSTTVEPKINSYKDRLYIESYQFWVYPENIQWEYGILNDYWAQTQQCPKTFVASGSFVIDNFMYHISGMDSIHLLGVIPVGELHNEVWAYNFPAYIDSPNTISGKVFLNTDSNCNYSIQDSSMKGWLVKAEPGPYYALSKNDGSYTLQVADTQYAITLLPPDIQKSLVDSSNCYTLEHRVQFNTLNQDTSGLDFGVVLEPCYSLQVELVSNFRRRCFTNQTVLNFSNLGMQSADSAFIILKYPEHLTIVNASVPFSIDSNDNYIFSIGTVGPQQSGSISITDSVKCGTIDILGLTQCVEASIYPKTNCTVNNGWNGAEVDVDASCENTGSVFSISNISNINMADSVEFRLFSDSLLLYTGKVKLMENQEFTKVIPATGATYRFEVDQVQNHPYNSMVNATIEACGNSQQNISLGYVNQYTQADQDVSVDIECLPIIGGYDPNDKLVSPEGIGSQNLTYPDSKLEYTIRFQNTGTDTAFNIEVVDTLSSILDLTTLVLGASSHHYDYELNFDGKPVLKFYFKNIELPDSNVNYDASNGFARYSIKPLPNNLGELVENKASIYFDFNPPIETNKTENLLGYPEFRYSSFIDSLFSVVGVSINQLSTIKVFPNPTDGILYIDLGSTSGYASLKVYNTVGQILEELNVENQKLLKLNADYPTGVYFVEITGNQMERKVLKFIKK